ncbi:hypothetical protein BP5796_11196 [Coleophoma crateriformis]|uniref:Uncharacterized protein n=1 Tax=Coleophoma crateriformis TaxID=565419 RepID=A0A3D8QIP0_9HELO|nr:hypothetical protein BP5796_11196 [Coleophoma crateriformis]
MNTITPADAQGRSHTFTSGPSRLRLHMARSNQFLTRSMYHTGDYAIPRCPSLPSLPLPKLVHPSEPSFKSRSPEIKRPSSANTIRRSVSGMKRLLPLKLTSPPLPTSTTWASPIPSSGPMRDVQQHAEHPQPSCYSPSFPSDAAFAGKRPSPLSRDVSIYSRQTPQHPSHSCPTDSSPTHYCPMGSSCNRFGCRFDGCPASEGAGLSPAYSSYVDSNDEQAISIDGVPAAIHPSHSELSFKCLGDRFFNEGSWLRKTSHQWNNTQFDYLPEVLIDNMPRSIDIEGWISDSTSYSSSDSDDEDDLSCATALAPARAQVVNVNRGNDLNIMIPPRSSSLARGNTPSSVGRGRKSRMSVRNERRPRTTRYIAAWNEWHEDSDDSLDERVGRSEIPRDRLDLAMASPPVSPTQSIRSSASIVEQSNVADGRATFGRSGTSLYQAVNRPDSPHSPTSSVMNIVDAIEGAVNGFPSTMLLLDAPCLGQIRTHLRQCPAVSETHSPHLSPFPTPAERRFHRSPLRGSRSHRKLRQPSLDRLQTRPLTPVSRTFPPLDRIDTSVGGSPPIKRLSSPLRSPTFLSLESRTSSSETGTTKSSPAPHNLQPLRTIFPKTSDFMRSALYAHILAYIFLTSLSHPASAQQQSQNPSVPIYTSTISIPSKAASTLGIPTGTKLSLINTNIHIQKLEEQVVTCIRKLVGGMEGKVGWSMEGDARGRFLDRVFLRALVEVVKGCEMRVFN